MKKMIINTTVTKMLADTYTPVGIYLRLRDQFRDTILLESTDSHASENSYSFIGVNAIGGIEISSLNEIEYKYPTQEPEKETINNVHAAPDRIWAYMQQYEMKGDTIKEAAFAQGLYGYTTYDAIPFFDTIQFKTGEPVIPLIMPTPSLTIFFW
jgi:anthranilate synthase component 1